MLPTVGQLRPALCMVLVLLLLSVALPRPAAADRWYAPDRILGAVDAGRQPDAARQAGVGWDRVVFQWQQIQPDGPDDWYLDRYIAWAGLQKSLKSGLPLLAVVQGTPRWAAGNPRDGTAGVPTGLDFPVTDPRNTFGRFMVRLARAFEGRVVAWIIWNEPDFRPGDAGDWWNWVGNTEDLFKVVRAGYRAVKAVDPEAQVVFPSTAFYPDAVHGRELFLARVLREASRDPEAARNGYYFDAVGLNLYCSIADIYRVHALYRQILAQYGLTKPIWLTETNCQMYNDATVPMDPQNRISTSEQAAFLLQAVAMARAAGYQRIGWYAMVDHEASGIPERWGLVRRDGSVRPAFRAFQVAARFLDGPGEARFLPFEGDPERNDWRVWRVVLDDPGRQRRVQVLWSGAGGPRTVRLPARGADAQLVDMLGRSYPLRAESGWWVVNLPTSRVAQSTDPPGFLALGDPVLLVEQGLAAGAPIGALRVDPAPSAQRFFASTGYVIEDGRIWSYYWRMGGPESLGDPVSYAFPFLGGTAQLFERAAIFVPAQGAPRLLDLGGPDFLPFRGLDPAVVLPPPTLPPSSAERQRDPTGWALGLVRTLGSEKIDLPYFRTVTCSLQPDPRCSIGYLPERALERYGLPLSAATVSPANPERHYQRFERGVLWSDGRRSGELPLGSLLKALLLGRDLPEGLAKEAQASRFFQQYDPSRPGFVARPKDLPQTSLAEAF
ncbi:MAG: hypothetical protein HY690_19070 [Chloroflexi bacterium]|nr:hypothetical protein [Chloroflexota bacterium]